MPKDTGPIRAYRMKRGGKYRTFLVQMHTPTSDSGTPVFCLID